MNQAGARRAQVHANFIGEVAEGLSSTSRSTSLLSLYMPFDLEITLSVPQIGNPWLHSSGNPLPPLTHNSLLQRINISHVKLVIPVCAHEVKQMLVFSMCL